jgi:uroporphyrin-III C-methyltransferase
MSPDATPDDTDTVTLPAAAAKDESGAAARDESATAAGDESAALEALGRLRPGYPLLAPGQVWLVGAGPGDPGLLTLDALAGLLQADVVVYDALVDSRILALARRGAKLEFAGKRGGKPSVAQADISQRLIEAARRGQRVLRLKGGDPFVFGRGGEEMMTLATAGVRFCVIPGITAGLGALGTSWIPATMRGLNQAIILATGHAADDEGGVDWAAMARTRQPIVVYMALRNLDAIAKALQHGGLPGSTPAAVIASATLEAQRVVVSSLERIVEDAQGAQLSAPALVVFGDIVRIRGELLALSTDVASRSTDDTPREGP